MKVLLTGAAGFIGYHVYHALVDAGHKVVAVDRVERAVSCKGERLAKGVTIHHDVDLTDFVAVDNLVAQEAPEAIVHLAGQFSVKYTTESMLRYVSGNLCAFTYILEAAKRNGVQRAVYASSIAVSDEGRPSGLYGATKAYNEQAAHAYAKRGLEAVGIRYAAAYGRYQRNDSPPYRGMAQVFEGAQLRLSEELQKQKLMIDVRDAAKATAKAVTAPLNEGHNVVLAAADDRQANLGHIIEAASEYLGIRPRFPKGYSPGERKAGPDLAHTERVLGWRPEIRLEEGIPEFAEWVMSREVA